MTAYSINPICKTYTKGMTMSNNVLSGDTYGAKEYIKAHWDGKWDANGKCWIVDPQKVISSIQAQEWGFAKVLAISEFVPAAPAEPKQVHGANGWCNKCHSWCYGDCEA